MGESALTDRRETLPSEVPVDSSARWLRPLAWAPLVLLPISGVLWAWTLPAVDLRAMNDYGLVSVLPGRIWASLILVIVSFAVCWWRGKNLVPLLSLHIVLFIIMFYGIPPIVSDAARGPIVYRHLGIVEYLTRDRVVNTDLDAYFNWPGFFMGLGSLIEIGRMGPGAVTLARWATVTVNLCYLPVLLVLFRAFTRNARLVWAATLLFFVANWINQDYLAPQSFTYVLYLAMVALMLHYLRPLESREVSWQPAADGGSGTAWAADQRHGDHRWKMLGRKLLIAGARPGPVPADVPGTARGGRTGLAVTVVVIGLFTASVTAHQLTPFAALFAVTLLVVTRHCRSQGLPVVMAVILSAWTLFAASGYIDGHLSHVVESSGVASSVQANVGSRLGGSDQHLVVVWGRLALTGCIWFLAAVGAVRRFRAGHRDHAAAILAISPLPLFLLPYGGEVILRLYFFMLPSIAFFVATLFIPVGSTAHRAWRPSSAPPLMAWRGGLLAVVMSVVMMVSFVARYGNERMDFYTPEEVAAVEELYRVAPPGSVLMAEVSYLPWRYQDYEWDRRDGSRGHRYLSLTDEWDRYPTKSPAEMAAWTAEVLAPRLVEGRPAGFLILTRSQRAHEQILGGLDDERLDEYTDALSRSHDFQVIVENRDATIYARVSSG